jgi:hypothetical protein
MISKKMKIYQILYTFEPSNLLLNDKNRFMYIDILVCLVILYLGIKFSIEAVLFIKSVILKQNSEVVSKKDIILQIIFKISVIAIWGTAIVRQVCRVLEDFQL